ncbi:MAG: tyrosine-type recombinase/integrase [Desulfurivibrionaceae bacterium]
MGAYKRKLSKGDRWFFSGQHINKKYFSKAIFLTKKEAVTAEREELARIDEQTRRPRGKIDLHTLMTARLDYIKGHKSNDYYKANQRYLKKLLGAVGNISAEEVRKEDIHRLVMEESARLKASNKTQHHANGMLRALKALFNWGNKIYDLDIRNPCNLDFMKIDKKIKHLPKEKEIDQVRESLTPTQRLLFDFVDETGCRIMEAIRFTSEDVRGDNIVLYTRKAKNSDLTPRVIPRPKCIESLIWDGKLFKEWKMYPRFLEGKANGWNWHNLRHRRASIWANEGRSIFEMMHLLGHSNMSTTMIYLQKLGVSIR